MAREVHGLIGLLEERAQAHAEAPLYSFIARDRDEHVTYGAFAEKARAVGARLLQVVKPRDRVLLLLPPGIDYIAAFFGCLYAGAIAVPAYPAGKLNRSLARLRVIAEDAKPSAVLTTDALSDRASSMEELAPELAALHWLTVEQAVREPLPWRPPATSQEDLAFLQYTSGSTANPRGVKLTHANVIANLAVIARGFDMSSSSRGMSWLPPYHDMGLIGGILTPIYVGIPSALMSPVDFLRRPLRWLEVISNYGATISGGPDFAYALAVSSSTEEQRAGLDLSRWQVAYNGAEPVRPETLDRFAHAFASSGFHRRAFYPCYGLAESTLMVTGGDAASAPRELRLEGGARQRMRDPRARVEFSVACAFEGGRASVEVVDVSRSGLGVRVLDDLEDAAGPVDLEVVLFGAVHALRGRFVDRGESGGVRRGAIALRFDDEEQRETWELTVDRLAEGHRDDRFVSSGRSADGHELRVVRVDAHTVCDDREVGEIWVRGPSVAQGYWGERAESSGTFGAKLADGRGPYLRTGDLGFVADGELFVTGRIKDLLVLRGRNHYPQDIERTAEASHPAVRTNATAAFEVDVEGEAVLVVAAEIDARGEGFDANAVMQAIRQAVAEAHEISPHAVVLVKKNALPKTSSGKIQRHACREAFVQRTFSLVDQSVVQTAGISVTAGPVSAGRREQRARDAVLAACAEFVPLALGAPEAPLTSVGLDSLRGIQLLHSIETSLGVSVDVARLLDGVSLDGLVEELVVTAAEPRAETPSDRAVRAEPQLSIGQEALSFLQQLEPTNAGANVVVSGHCPDKLDPLALENAFRALLERHATLRTRVPTEGTASVVRIDDPERVPFEVVDARGWPLQQVLDALERSALTPFDLREHAPVRLSVYRHDGGDFVLFAAHHACVDFWSLGVLFRDLHAHYGAPSPPRANGAPAVTYDAFVRWQRAWIGSPEADAALRHFRDVLRDAPRSSPLDAMTRPTRAVGGRGARRLVSLSSELVHTVNAWAAARGVTPYVVYLSVFQALLARFSGERDLIVTSPVSGRDATRWKDVVGYFVNALPFRARVEADTTFEELIAGNAQAVRLALRHQMVPYAKVVEDQRLQGVRWHRVLFTLQQGRRDERLGPFSVGARGAQLRLGSGTAMIAVPLDHVPVPADLGFVIVDDVEGEGLLVCAEYATASLAPEEVDVLLSSFVRLLRGAVSASTTPLAELSLLDEERRKRILIDWNRRAAPVPDDVRSHTFFERRAEAHPERVAVRCDARTITYGELLRASRHMASRLHAAGARPGTVVGLHAARSIEMVVGLLGILMSGAAYLPLDPTYPSDRLAYMLEDSGARVLVAHGPLDARLEGHLDVVLRAEASPASAEPAIVRAPVHAAHTAYVLYTSGSTGQPKGSRNPHAAVASLLLSIAKAPGIRETDRLLSASSLSFDIGSLEILLPLSHGAELVVASDADAGDGFRLRALFDAHEPTIMQATPSRWRALLEAGWTPTPELTLFVGGEPMTFDLRSKLVASSKAVWNMYGPTETTIYSVIQPMDHLDGPILIGRPVDNTSLYVLDDRAEPVPPGVVGELCIAGRGLAEGYLGRPALTAGAFVPHPFADGERMYRTGDLARWTTDGAVECLGRRDHQVKLRGFRIELGEIEAALARQPEVTRAAAVARASTSGDARVLAFVILAEGTGDDALPRLRERLAASLPTFMVPAQILRLDAFPLTPSGKLDRRALPDVETPRPPFVAPTTETEKAIAEAWSAALQIDEVGVHDNFFELGGHSVLSVRVVRLLAEKNIEITLRDLFERPTLADVARSAKSKSPASAPRKRARFGMSALPEAQLDALKRKFGTSEGEG